MWNLFKRKKHEERSGLSRDNLTAAFASIFGIDTLSFSYNPLSIGTAYACIRLNANAISQTELQLYKRLEDGKSERIFKHPALDLLNNPYFNQTNFIWLSTMATQFSGRGNAYSYLVRENGIDVTQIIFIPNDQVQIKETFYNRIPYYYTVTFNDGTQADIQADDMLHYRNISENGYEGLSPIEQHKRVFETAQSEALYKKTFFDNASQISGVIESPLGLKKETIKQMRENFGTIYGGAENAGKTAVLGGGASYRQIKPISPQDADFISSRKLTKEEILQIYGVPPPMLGDVTATYANSEQLALIYQEYTVSPLLVNIEQELTLKLLNIYPNLYFEFVPDLTKMSTTRDRAETAAIYKREGIYTTNEIRARNGYAPIDGGDLLTQPLNSGVATEEEAPDDMDPDPEGEENGK